MRAAALVLFAVVAGGCAPMKSIDRLDAEFAAAKQRRRVVALASPT